MNKARIAAAALAFATGLAHSVMGEWLIFQRMLRGTVVPTLGGELLRQRHVRILWANLHAFTLLGWGLAAMLLMLSSVPPDALTQGLAQIIAVALLGGASAVSVGTRGQHPGWVAMALFGLLAELGSRPLG